MHTSALAMVASGLLLAAATGTAEPLKIPLSVYVTGAVLDGHSTYRVLQYDGLREGNPLVGWLDDRPKTMIAVGAAADVATVYLLYRWIGRSHPRLTRVALYAVGSARVGLAIRNYRLTAGHVRQ